MNIWFNKELSIAQINALNKGNMGEHLGIECVEIGDDFLKAKMPVDHRTKQAYGLLHGGASCVLAETIGSFGATLVVDPDRFQCVGVDINANHVHSAIGGFVTGIARPLHIGKSTHVWEIKIYNEKDKMVCVSRLTMAVIEKRDFTKSRSL